MQNNNLIVGNEAGLTPIPHDVAIYSVTEVASILRTSKHYVYKLIRSGNLPCITIGRIKIRHDSLVEFLKKAEGYDYNDPYNVKVAI